MNENTIAYIIWLLISLIFIVLGVYDWKNAKNGSAFGFYNISPPPKTEQLTDVTAYNRAVSKLFIISGILFALIGLPLIYSNNEAIIVLVGVLGAIFWVIGMVLAYECIIMKKYRRKK